MLLVCVGGIRLARKGHTVGPPIVRWVVPSTHRDFSAVLYPIELIFCMWVGSTITLLPTENQLIWLKNCREITVGGWHHPPYYRRADCTKVYLQKTCRGTWGKTRPLRKGSFYPSYKEGYIYRLENWLLIRG